MTNEELLKRMKEITKPRSEEVRELIRLKNLRLKELAKASKILEPRQLKAGKNYLAKYRFGNTRHIIEIIEISIKKNWIKYTTKESNYEVLMQLKIFNLAWEVSELPPVLRKEQND